MRYPDLSGSRHLVFDVETYDPHLTELGPGEYRDDGSKLLGCAISDGEGFNEYYNLGHYDCDASEREHNVKWLRETLALPMPKIGQHAIYDLDWLENGEYALKVNGRIISIDIAEALIDETLMHYNLDSMASRRLGEHKVKGSPERFCEENHLKGDFRKWLWKMPYDLVRDYAMGDTDLPARIWAQQEKELEAQELMDLFNLECDLVRCLALFRRTGVRIDADVRDRNAFKIQCMIEEMEQWLFARHGEFNYGSGMQLAPVFDKMGIKYPLTDKKNPNIDAYFFKLQRDPELELDGLMDMVRTRPSDVPLINLVYELRRAKHHLNTFLLGSHVRFIGPDGLMHPQFFNMRNDMLGALKGTRSGRLSGVNPNLQQQPAKGVDEFWGQICREDFVPFPDCWWLKIDYSQIEYRFMAHFAMGPGSEELRRAYNTNPNQDYHQFIMDLTGLKRRYAKNLNFGVAFGMGAAHMAELFGWTLDYCYDVLRVYHDRAPYVKATVDLVERVAKSRGYIKTFLKRRSHLKDPRKAYTMYCRLMQGSAADLMKKAMVECHKAGVFDVLPPHVTVHDELGVSMAKTRVGVEAGMEMQHIMENCLTLRVPIKAEAEVGKSWADVEERSWDDLMKEVT